MTIIEQILDIPKRNADRPFLIDGLSGKTFNYNDVFEAGSAIGASLADRGLTRGDRVAILLPNSTAFAKLYFGCLFAGVVTVPVNPILSKDEINFILKHCAAKVLVTVPALVSQLDISVLDKREIDVLVLLDGQPTEEVQEQFEVWDISALPKPESFVPFDGVSTDDVMTIVYTSGTTASPKGVVYCIGHMFENAQLFNRRLGIGPENRFYGVLAMTNMPGYYNLLMLPYIAEASVVIVDAFNARSVLSFWQPAEQHGVNTLWLVPTMMSMLIEMDRGKDGEKFCRDCIHFALVGTAPLPVQLRHDFEARYGISLYENYGLSETLFISTNALSLPVLDGSVGQTLPGIQITIMDEAGRALPYGKEGEIHVCTPNLMKGYYDSECGDADPFPRDDWFPTGDIGILSSVGNLFITGRKKDLIIRGGVNISPAGIENVLHQHPAVIECAVVGIPHALYGEDVAAVVRLSEGTIFGTVKAELTSACKTHLSTAKQPAHILEVETFPHSTSGKIQKANVRNLLIHKLGLSQISIHNRPSELSDSQPALVPACQIRQQFNRLSPHIIQSFQNFSVRLVADCMHQMGTMNSDMRPLFVSPRMCGSAVTVEETGGGCLMGDVALELLQPGDVLVIDAKGQGSGSNLGKLQMMMAKKRGAAGVVVDGTVCDIDAMSELGVPLFALGAKPQGCMTGSAGRLNYPVSCAGTVVFPGDIVIGDSDGVLVIPQDQAEKLLPLCQRREDLEATWGEQIQKGASTLDILGGRAKLRDLGIELDAESEESQ